MRPTTNKLWILPLLALTGCLQWPERDPRPPDEILWTHAIQACERQRCDVARLTLETMINTYPESKHAAEADQVLRDPAPEGCRRT